MRARLRLALGKYERTHSGSERNEGEESRSDRKWPGARDYAGRPSREVGENLILAVDRVPLPANRGANLKEKLRTRRRNTLLGHTLDVESTSAHIGHIWKVCGKGLKREENPARLAARDGELIAGRGQLIRRSE
jgi:hypothetical protein